MRDKVRYRTKKNHNRSKSRKPHPLSNLKPCVSTCTPTPYPLQCFRRRAPNTVPDIDPASCVGVGDPAQDVEGRGSDPEIERDEGLMYCLAAVAATRRSERMGMVVKGGYGERGDADRVR